MRLCVCRLAGNGVVQAGKEGPALVWCLCCAGVAVKANLAVGGLSMHLSFLTHPCTLHAAYCKNISTDRTTVIPAADGDAQTILNVESARARMLRVSYSCMGSCNVCVF